MNSSLYTLDRATHLKIVLVALVTAAVVLTVGENARVDRTASAAPAPPPMQPLLQPTPQPLWRSTPSLRPPISAV